MTGCGLYATGVVSGPDRGGRRSLPVHRSPVQTDGEQQPQAVVLEVAEAVSDPLDLLMWNGLSTRSHEVPTWGTEEGGVRACSRSPNLHYGSRERQWHPSTTPEAADGQRELYCGYRRPLVDTRD